jgi:hypothetical protein
MTKFQSGFIKAAKGVQADQAAELNFRKATAALQTQIAVMNGETVTKEVEVSEAKAAVESALINNGKDISDRESYLLNLVAANNKLKAAEKALNEHKTALGFFTNKLQEISATES